MCLGGSGQEGLFSEAEVLAAGDQETTEGAGDHGHCTTLLVVYRQNQIGVPNSLGHRS
jgi:hypothetical protein